MFRARTPPWLTGKTTAPIVFWMLRRRCSKADRATALAVTLSVLAVALASTGALAAGLDGPGEACFNCSGCDTGECGDVDGSPPTSHHHCCVTSCLSHAPATLSSPSPAPAPVIVGPMARVASVTVASLAPETPYRPPRA